MTILFIGPLPEPVTGQSIACRVLFDALRTEHRVELVDLSKKDFRQGLSSTTRVVEIGRILWRIWRTRRRADVIYLTVSQSLAGNLKDLCIYSLCYRQLGRLITHLHGGAGMERIMLGDRAVLRRLNAYFLRRLGAAVVLGQSHVRIYQGVVPDARIHVVPNCAEDSFFTTLERIDDKFMQINPLRLLFLSNLLPGKGHDELVHAYLALDGSTRASIRIDFAGGFESDRHKEAFLRKVAGADGIQYHGTVAGERKRSLLDQAHVFCLPTYYPYEGQPVSILEAYASGCAVITTNHSGIRDVFRPEVNGFEVAQRSVADLRSAIERAAAEPERLRQMATRNLQTATANYRASEYSAALTRIIGSVARRN
jgi:glycosyltransferase involved in cell wall biosynthesis